MENKNQTCPIWGVTVARIQQLHDMDGCLIEGSPRTGGDYKITGHAMDLGDIGDLDPAQKARLTTMLIEMRRRGDHAPVVKLDLIEEAKRADPLSHLDASREAPSVLGQHTATTLDKSLRFQVHQPTIWRPWRGPSR